MGGCIHSSKVLPRKSCAVDDSWLGAYKGPLVAPYAPNGARSQGAERIE
jgi:hypothetical protein